MGASPHAGCHCPGTRADAFRVVFARNPVAHTPRKHVEGALKHAKITAKTLRQVMRRKLRSTGRKSATNYLSGTTLILTINMFCNVDADDAKLLHGTRLPWLNNF